MTVAPAWPSCKRLVAVEPTPGRKPASRANPTGTVTLLAAIRPNSSCSRRRPRGLVRDQCAISGDRAGVPVNLDHDPTGGVPSLRALGEAREKALD